jgi:hypothetical protein
MPKTFPATSPLPKFKITLDKKEVLVAIRFWINLVRVTKLHRLAKTYKGRDGRERKLRLASLLKRIVDLILSLQLLPLRTLSQREIRIIIIQETKVLSNLSEIKIHMLRPRSRTLQTASQRISRNKMAWNLRLNFRNG